MLSRWALWYNKTMKLVILIIIIVVIGAFFVKTYTSSPGFVTAEAMAEFEANSPKCYGYSHLLNAEEVAADAPGKSLCIGVLK